MIRTGTVALAITLLAPAVPAAAQINMSHELNRLHESVMTLATAGTTSGSFQADLADVARLHGGVAAMRAAGDPRQFKCMMDQVALLAATGQVDAALNMAANTAARAEAQYEYFDAAQATVMAVGLARQAGDFEAAERFRGRAEWLATLPALDAQQSQLIATRLYAEQWKVASTPPAVSD